MKRNPIVAAVCLAALSLTACSENHRQAANSKLCADFKAKTAPALTVADGAAPVEDCTRRWAYSLASSQDDATVVADAVVAACTTQLSRWNQQILNQPGAEGEATSITTGEPTTPFAEHRAFTASRALFYVVQARAGGCAAPPIVNGAPEGLS
jgi:hypothetical protein